MHNKKHNNKRYSERHVEEIQPLGVLPPDQMEELRRAIKLTGLDALFKMSKEKEKKFIESEDVVEYIPIESNGEVVAREPLIKPAKNPGEDGSFNFNEYFARKNKPK